MSMSNEKQVEQHQYFVEQALSRFRGYEPVSSFVVDTDGGRIGLFLLYSPENYNYHIVTARQFMPTPNERVIANITSSLPAGEFFFKQIRREFTSLISDYLSYLDQ